MRIRVTHPQIATPFMVALLALPACGPSGPSSEAHSTTASSGMTSSTGASAPPTGGTLPYTETTDTAGVGSAGTTTDPDSHSSGSGVAPDLVMTGVECDPFSPACPTGQKCAPWHGGGGEASWNAARCVGLTGDALPGEPCVAPEGPYGGVDDCGAGSLCWDLDEGNHGTCVLMCTGTFSEPICPPASLCVSASDQVFSVCSPPCNPLTQDCPTDEICISSIDKWFCSVDGSGREGQFNDPCNFSNDCDKGLACLDAATASESCDVQAAYCCQPLCKYPGGPCPNPDQECLPWYDPMDDVPPGYESVGVCAISK